MASQRDLGAAISRPIEDLSFEYKAWLDVSTSHGRATIAKAVIALENHGGGFIVIGFEEEGNRLRSVPRPEDHRAITQDLINGAIQRFVDPPIHVEMQLVRHPETGVEHPILLIPGTAATPVMACRDCDGVLKQMRVYVRKPGPMSEEPRTTEEWRSLFDRCVQRRRADMLGSIRAIVEGRIEESRAAPNVMDELADFAEAGRTRWTYLLDEAGLALDAPARFPHGRYEIALALPGATPAPSLAELRRRITQAHGVRHTGWPAFVDMGSEEFAPRVQDGLIEAWIGRPAERLWDDAAHSDFWRIAPGGKLLLMRGYQEDTIPERRPPGQMLDITLPVWRVGEAMLFTRRLAHTFEGAGEMAIQVHYEGLADRALDSVDGTRIVSASRRSQTDTVNLQITAPIGQVDDNLAEILHQLLSPLYECFDFFELPQGLVDQELDRLTGGRF